MMVYTNSNAMINSADSPAPLTPGIIDPTTGTQAAVIARNSVSLIGNEAPNQGMNNLGWITDGTNITDGNNVEAGIDRVAPDGVDAPQPGDTACPDISGDALPELILTTNSLTVPTSATSHTRLLENRRRNGGGIRDREFVDRTLELMPGPRTGATFGGGSPFVGDNWRGQDMWVGDIDTSGGVPDILIVHDELKHEPNVDCGNYCSSAVTYPFQYHFYWGGARALLWDATLRDGNGKFRFAHEFFPRKSGVAVAIAIPGGGTITGCSAPCAGKFPPFIGQKIRVGRIDSDAKLDIAVLSSGTVQAYGATVSSLQVALNRPSTATGSAVTDVTPRLTELAGDYRGNAITIGQPFSAYGTIAISKLLGGGSGSVLKLLQAKASTVEGELITFQDISSTKLPAVSVDDKWQAADIRFADANGDRLEDLILLSNAPVGAGGMSFRILRSVVDAGTVRFEESFKSILSPLALGGDTFDGFVMQIGDLNGDGANEYIITRATAGGGASQTRVITTDLGN
jgi:hypothetical protein